MSVHRLFVALRPPRAVRQHLIDAMQGVAGARWQDDDQLHLTLRYVGEVDRHRAEDVAAALGSVHAAAVTARIAGAGLFARRDVPHTLWARVEPAGPITALHQAVNVVLQRAGIAPDARAFVPHITLARLNRSAGPVAPFIARASDLVTPDFVMDHVILYESELARDGARYHPVARYPLAARTAAA
jgi:RNA 2',3'-cyclic 3'-phosphodiesterase